MKPTSEQMQSLEWQSFQTYPQQNSHIYVYCKGTAYAGMQCKHRFVEIKAFNAVMFNPYDLVRTIHEKMQWKFMWLTARSVMSQLKYFK